ncbi:hypothetical protein BHE74_00002854 [Ensete ventricosum]|nr:hypothetical protein BHE74_00002854 [Ensete ventricosum]
MKTNEFFGFTSMRWVSVFCLLRSIGLQIGLASVCTSIRLWSGRIRFQMIKYGVVQMHHLAMDVLTWDRFYLSGRLQKPVLVCGPPTTGWYRRLELFLSRYHSKSTGNNRYRPLVADFGRYQPREGERRRGRKKNLESVDLSPTGDFFSPRREKKHLPEWVEGTRRPHTKLRSISIVGITKTQTIITSRELAANCVTKALRRLVLISSARQAMSGLAATGGVAAARYLTRKISKAWKSRTS